MPTVSVILTTYNRSHLLSRSIRSVLNQTYQDFELIIVDDCSTDDTEKVVRRFNSEKIKYIRHKKNKGVSAARNTGIRAAKGDYIAFQDDDDEWMPEKLEKQVKAFMTASPEVGLIYTNRHQIDVHGNYMPPARVVQREGHIFSSLLQFDRSFITLSSVLVKRVSFEKVGMFDESIRCVEDWELFLRMSKYYQFKYIDELLVTAYCQPYSASTKYGERLKGLKQILETHFEHIKRDKKVLARYYYWLGDLSCAVGKLSQGRDYFVKSLKAYPLNIVVFIAFMVSLFGGRIYNMVARRYRVRKILCRRVYRTLFMNSAVISKTKYHP